MVKRLALRPATKEQHTIPLVYIYLGLAGLILLIVFVWRLASRRYSFPCPAWLGWLVEFDNPFTESNSARAIVRHLELHAGMKVLDAGCGPGRLTIPIAEEIGPQGEVVAMDIQAGMLRRAQQKAQAANLNNIRFLPLTHPSDHPSQRNEQWALWPSALICQFTIYQFPNLPTPE